MESGWPTGLGTCSGSILVDGFFEVSVLSRSEAKTNPLSLRLDVGEAVGAPNFRGVPAHAAARAARALGTCGLLERIARIGPGSCFFHSIHAKSLLSGPPGLASLIGNDSRSMPRIAPRRVARWGEGHWGGIGGRCLRARRITPSIHHEGRCASRFSRRFRGWPGGGDI